MERNVALAEKELERWEATKRKRQAAEQTAGMNVLEKLKSKLAHKIKKFDAKDEKELGGLLTR